MQTSNWISGQVAKLLPHVGVMNNLAPASALPGAATLLANAAELAPAQVSGACAAPAKQTLWSRFGRPVKLAPRSSFERLSASLRRGDETMSPRALRRLLSDLQAILVPQIGEVEAGLQAAQVLQWYRKASLAQRLDCCLLLSEQFAPDVKIIHQARANFELTHGSAEAGLSEVALRRALQSPRSRLLQRFAVAPGGLRFLLDLRAELLAQAKVDKRLLALDGELESLFSIWFDIAFLELRRISWDSPASLIEKLIQYEAVHDIRSWADVKNRLDSDRRCYGFFHPQLANEPLIFIEVALLDKLPDTIAPLLDETAAPDDLKQATTAIFYSISSTQKGLHGVSFGDALIKRVVATLKSEFPRLRSFATLSPIPGLRQWLGKNAAAMLDRLDAKRRGALATELALPTIDESTVLHALEKVSSLTAKSALKHFLMQCAASYLSEQLQGGKPLDPVTRFHLGNGARIERLNWLGDVSAKGLRQSYGLMVNYLYDLKRLDKYRADFAKGRLALSSAVESLRF